MGNISNKNQLTQRYNRRYITSSSNDTSKDNVSGNGKIDWDYIKSHRVAIWNTLINNK